MALPMYRQIADDLRSKIESGEFRHGQQLPTEPELKETYAASRNTVRDAIKFLTSRGLAETRPGQGTFVVQEIAPIVSDLGPAPGYGLGSDSSFYLSETPSSRGFFEATIPRVEIRQADPMLAGQLRLPDGAEVVSRQQQRFIESTPWSVQTSYYPLELVQRGATRLLSAEELTEGAIRYIEETIAIKQAGWTDRIAVRAPDLPEAEFFSLPADGRVAVIEITRTGYDPYGTPFRVTMSSYPADRNQFTVSFGDVPSVKPQVAAVPRQQAPDRRMAGDRKAAVAALER